MVNVVINCLSALSGGGQTNIINLLNYFPKNGYKFILIANSKNIELLSNKLWSP